MREQLSALALLGLCACTIEPLGDERVVYTRAIPVKQADVQVFAAEAPPAGKYTVMEKIWVKDDGSDSPAEMLEQLRVKAGSIGANGLILANTNREDNNLRVSFKPTLDNPFDYYAAQAIWVGDGGPKVKVLHPGK